VKLQEKCFDAGCPISIFFLSDSKVFLRTVVVSVWIDYREEGIAAAKIVIFENRLTMVGSE
jgi:hypothetical protein